MGRPVPVRPGDTILDPSLQRNLVLAARGGRLLLQDPSGFQFVLSARRLGSGWRPLVKRRRRA